MQNGKGLLGRLRAYASDSAAILRNRTCEVLNVSLNEQSCNLNCRVCGFSNPDVRSMYSTRSAMSLETFQKLVDAVPNRRTFQFDISAIAETLQFKELPYYIGLLKRARPLVKTVISTNGTLLTEKLCEDLVASGLDGIQFSLYAPDAAGYKFITQTDFPYERVLTNLDLLLGARGGRKTPSIWLFIYDIQDYRARSVDLTERYRGRIDEVYFRALYDTAGVTAHGLGEVPAERYPCGMLWYSGAIRSNGDFLMCYPAQWLDRTHSVGNVHVDSLASYWQKLEEPRRLHLAGRWNEIPACKNCDVWKSTPSVFARRTDGTFYIPRHRWVLARVVNFLKEAGFKRPGARVHRS